MARRMHIDMAAMNYTPVASSGTGESTRGPDLIVEKLKVAEEAEHKRVATDIEQKELLIKT